MSFTLHIVGVSATAPVSSSAASGYLLAGPDGSVLVDCGPGIVMELARQRLLDDVVAVVVTHRHADHALDLGALAYRLQFPSPRPAPVPLYLPAESLDFVAQFDRLIGIATVPTLHAPLAQAFDVRGLDLDSAEPFEVIPGLQLTAFAAHHAVPSASLRFEDVVTGAIVAFSSDTSECAGVRAAAAGADLFVCEATYLTATMAELQGHGHLTGEGAGRLAAEAGVRTLLVSHIADQSLAPQILADAAQAAGGDVATVLAKPGDRYPLTHRATALTLRPH